jgi:FKBP-type peptidyl-prolyl cis-trans isomerase
MKAMLRPWAAGASFLAAFALLALPSCGLFRARAPYYPTYLHDNGLVITDLLVPTGRDLPVAERGRRVVIDYEARLENGDLIDSSMERGQPAEFVLGSGEMPLVGLEEGVLGMVQRGRRRIVAPPELAFGAEGIPGRVPPDATIEFIVELRRVEDPE